MAVRLVSRVVTPRKRVAAFSNATAVTVATMLVLSASVFNKGTLNMIWSLLGAPQPVTLDIVPGED
jgi:hypothetical protein